MTDKCTISGNSAGKYGGGLFNNAGAAVLTLTDSTVSDNSAGELGHGVINLFGSATLTNCTVTGNGLRQTRRRCVQLRRFGLADSGHLHHQRQFRRRLWWRRIRRMAALPR